MSHHYGHNDRWEVADSLYRFLDTDGDGTGSKDGAVDGSSTPVELFIQPPPGEIYFIERVIVNVADTSVGWSDDKYGAIDTLSNGLKVEVHKAPGDQVVLDLLDGQPVVAGGDWARICFDALVLSLGGGGSSNLLSIRWTFSRSGRPLVLHGVSKHNQYGERLVVTIQDDLTGLLKHSFMAQGWKEYETRENV